MYEVHGIVEVAGKKAKQLKKKTEKVKTQQIHTYIQANE